MKYLKHIRIEIHMNLEMQRDPTLTVSAAQTLSTLALMLSKVYYPSLKCTQIYANIRQLHLSFSAQEFNFIIGLLRLFIIPRKRQVEKGHSLNSTPARAIDRVARAKERKTVSASVQGQQKHLTLVRSNQGPYSKKNCVWGSTVNSLLLAQSI